MKYLHIMNYSNYTVASAFVRFIGDFFPNEEHTFAFVGNFDNKYSHLDSRCRVIHLKKREELIPYMKEAGLIILHAMTFNAKMHIISLLNPKIMRKIVWVAWGGDLYKDKPEQNAKKTWVQCLKKCINKNVKTLFIRRLHFFVSIFDPDAKYFEENYKSKAKILKTSYVGGCYDEIYQKSFDYTNLEEKYKNGGCINILVGHQSNPELNHIRVLNNLLAYKDENIRIFVPLSYGDRANVVYVEEHAKKLYGEKVTILKEWMSLEEYNALLAEMDIAIFDTVRQVALGNINKLIYMQKKVYLFPDSVMFNYYKSNGACVYNCTDIGELNFYDFIRNFKDNMGVGFVKSWLSDKDIKIKAWRDIFCLLEK